MKLGLVIDLDTCVGCHACATACKEWNASSKVSNALSDYQPFGAEPSGVWFNRVRHYEVGEYPLSKTINFPMSCLHCEDADCVSVCPTGASYKREDGIVLVDQDKCMGCNLCAWACPYGARELDEATGTMKKCTLCVDRIYDTMLAPEDRQPACVLVCPTHARLFGDLDDPASEVSRVSEERGGFGLLAELGYRPVNRYLPPRQPKTVLSDDDARTLLDRGLASLASPLIRR
ncbi:MAG TPA: 4Fe-4S dicluster domain-containing protein [Casimicrobiaceae bacterium]|nr:4Fe-4S dicluster domain-containing protein [Casimicrobiaceae bacterium]